MKGFNLDFLEIAREIIQGPEFYLSVKKIFFIPAKAGPGFIRPMFGNWDFYVLEGLNNDKKITPDLELFLIFSPQINYPFLFF